MQAEERQRPTAARTSDQILSEIRDYCRATQTAESTFGRLEDRGSRTGFPSNSATCSRVGNSMRSLRGQIGRFGRLLSDTGPDALGPASAVASIAGFHLFPFGGLRKTGAWLRSYGDAEMFQKQS